MNDGILLRKLFCIWKNALKVKCPGFVIFFFSLNIHYYNSLNIDYIQLSLKSKNNTHILNKSWNVKNDSIDACLYTIIKIWKAMFFPENKKQENCLRNLISRFKKCTQAHWNKKMQHTIHKKMHYASSKY